MTSAAHAEQPIALFDYIGEVFADAAERANPPLALVPDLPDDETTVEVDAEAPPSMFDKIAAEQAKYEHAHRWIAAAEVPIDIPTARRASYRGSFRTQENMRIDALEVYCRLCRRPLDEVGAESDCDARIDNTHLIGGNPGERAKRKVPEIRGVIKKQVIDRRGMAGYSVHAGK